MSESGKNHQQAAERNDIGTLEPLFRFTLSAWILVAVNAIPVFGGLFLNWDIRSILIIYWAENLVIGFYNVLKMACAKEGDVKQKLFLIPFFSVHFGGFCAVHGVFILVLTSFSSSAGGFGSGFSPIEGAFDWPGPFAFLAIFINVISTIWNVFGFSVAVPVLGLIFSHGISFWQNFIQKGEYLERDPHSQMFRPYGRVVIMHVGIIFAALPIFLLGSPMPLLILLVIMKTALDLVLHRISHSQNSLSVRLQMMINARLDRARRK